jgi:hypothetical protein
MRSHPNGPVPTIAQAFDLAPRPYARLGPLQSSVLELR